MRNELKNIEQLQEQLKELRYQLEEANDTIEAIRTGQVDALILDGENGHELYTLKTADHTYRIFIEKMIEGALTLNREGIILYSNSRFAQMVGEHLTGVIGRRFQDFIVDSDKERFTTIFEGSWIENYKEEMCLVTAAGEMPVQVSLTSLALEEGPALSVFLTDLTAQKKTQKQLEDNNRQLSDLNYALERSNNDLLQFASVASHDLQEPLRKIQIFSNLLKTNGDSANGELEKYTAKIVDAARRMRTLIVDVLNYSKLSANDNSFERIDLNDIVDEVLDDFELQISEKEARITTGDLPAIECVRGQIRQVFQNILSNALKFSKKGENPVIEINGRLLREKSFDSPADVNGSYCLVTIKDNGIGFDEKYHANIFALFERLNSKETYEGTGIGMAITKKIMEKHNGMVVAKSKPGAGATFMLLFPVKQDQ